MQDVLTA